jgi:hypothetical protein
MSIHGACHTGYFAEDETGFLELDAANVERGFRRVGYGHSARLRATRLGRSLLNGGKRFLLFDLAANMGAPSSLLRAGFNPHGAPGIG